MRKKGISPLISTVLLIGFVVALAVIVTNWGLDYVEEITERTEKTTRSALDCINDLNFEIKEVLCGAAGNSITIDNRGEKEIESLIFRIHRGTGDVTPTELDGVPAFGVKSYSEMGLIGATQLDVIAKILDDDGNAIICDQVIKERKLQC